MPSYELCVFVAHDDRTEEGRLLVVRGGKFWRAEVWEGRGLLAQFDHTATRSSPELLNLGKTAFLERLRTIAECVHGIGFDFGIGV